MNLKIYNSKEISLSDQRMVSGGLLTPAEAELLGMFVAFEVGMAKGLYNSVVKFWDEL